MVGVQRKGPLGLHHGEDSAEVSTLMHIIIYIRVQYIEYVSIDLINPCESLVYFKPKLNIKGLLEPQPFVPNL